MNDSQMLAVSRAQSEASLDTAKHLAKVKEALGRR